jgi:hypothetical protein
MDDLKTPCLARSAGFCVLSFLKLYYSLTSIGLTPMPGLGTTKDENGVVAIIR